MNFLAKPFSVLLEILYNFVGNYGLSIIILSLVIRLALYPVYKKQILSTTNGAEIQKRTKEIQQKYANDREMMNIKLTEMYRETGYSPTSGCLPMIVQMVVIFGLFALFRNPLNYYTGSDNMVFAIHESFLWIKDLTQPDQWILPIIAAVGTFFAQSMTMKNNPSPAAGPMNYILKYGFPVMFLWLARTYPAALAIYWCISQLLQIVFNLRFNQLKRQQVFNEAAAKAKRKKSAK